MFIKGIIRFYSQNVACLGWAQPASKKGSSTVRKVCIFTSLASWWCAALNSCWVLDCFLLSRLPYFLVLVLFTSPLPLLLHLVSIILYYRL